MKLFQGVTETVGIMLHYKDTYWNKKGRKQHDFHIGVYYIF